MTERRQAEGLLPHLGKLRRFALQQFRDACTARGWHDLASRFNGRLPAADRRIARFDADALRAELDAMAGRTQALFLTARLDAAIGKAVGATRADVIETVIAWARERATAVGVELAAAAVVHLGDRTDAERFAHVAGAILAHPDAEAIAADTRFAVALKAPA